MDSPKEEILSSPKGLLTTEFWKSLIYAGLSIATGLGLIGPGVPDKYKAIIDSAAFIAGAISVGAYAMSRGKTKAAAIAATANVMNNDNAIALERQKAHLTKQPQRSS
jgi:hypothetical protein